MRFKDSLEDTKIARPQRHEDTKKNFVTWRLCSKFLKRDSQGNAKMLRKTSCLSAFVAKIFAAKKYFVTLRLRGKTKKINLSIQSPHKE